MAMHGKQFSAGLGGAAHQCHVFWSWSRQERIKGDSVYSSDRTTWACVAEL